MTVYGIVLQRTGASNVFRTKVLDCEACDVWSVTHVLLFFLFGLLYPNKHILFLMLGIGWELTETYLGKYKITVNDISFLLRNDISIAEHNNESYWYGRTEDIGFNMIGYIVGDTLRNLNKIL